MLTIKSCFPSCVPIDGQLIKITVARMKVGEASAFRRAYHRLTAPESIRILSTRKPGEEQEKRLVPRPPTAEENAEPEAEVFLIPDAEIRRRRLAEMSPAEREAFDVLDAREDVENDAFIEKAIAQYVTVEAGQIEETNMATGDVTAVTTGADLVRIFSSRPSVLVDLVTVIRIENMLPESQKQLLRALFTTAPAAAADVPAGEAQHV